MPILSITMRSQDLDNTNNAEKTIKLEQTYKMRYMKLLHIYHNIDNANISDSSGTSTNSILFAKIDFLNGQNAVYTEINNNEVIEHNGMICLGETIKDSNTSTFRDAYKVLHEGKDLLYINQPFKIQLFKLESVDVAEGNTDLQVYKDSESHLIKPITQDQFRGNLNSAGQYLSLVFEYQEDYSQ